MELTERKRYQMSRVITIMQSLGYVHSIDPSGGYAIGYDLMSRPVYVLDVYRNVLKLEAMSDDEVAEMLMNNRKENEK